MSNRDTILSVRVSADEAAAIRHAAEFHGLSVSDYLRRHVVAAARRPQLRLCNLCNGSGRISKSFSSPNSFGQVSSPCPNGCHGPMLMNVS